MWSNPEDTYSGIWHNVTDKYLGFEISAGSEVEYGWIRFDTDACNNIVLVDYAFENTPNTPIIAGAIPTPEAPNIYLLLPTLTIIPLRFVWRYKRRENGQS